MILFQTGTRLFNKAVNGVDTLDDGNAADVTAAEDDDDGDVSADAAFAFFSQ